MLAHSNRVYFSFRKKTLRYISPSWDLQISLVINVYFLIYFLTYLLAHKLSVPLYNIVRSKNGVKNL